jgi:hypothetical protein
MRTQLSPQSSITMSKTGIKTEMYLIVSVFDWLVRKELCNLCQRDLYE